MQYSKLHIFKKKKQLILPSSSAKNESNFNQIWKTFMSDSHCHRQSFKTYVKRMRRKSSHLLRSYSIPNLCSLFVASRAEVKTLMINRCSFRRMKIYIWYERNFENSSLRFASLTFSRGVVWKQVEIKYALLQIYGIFSMCVHCTLYRRRTFEICFTKFTHIASLFFCWLPVTMYRQRNNYTLPHESI